MVLLNCHTTLTLAVSIRLFGTVAVHDRVKLSLTSGIPKVSIDI